MIFDKNGLAWNIEGGVIQSILDVPEWHPEIVGMSTDILPFYARVALELPERPLIAEIGTFRGRSILFLAETLIKLGKTPLLYAVDPWTPEDYHAGEKQDFFANMHRLGLSNYIFPTLKTSAESAKGIRNRSLDLVFIDGDHNYAEVEQDIRLWQPKVKAGGILAGHDYGHPELPGVKQAVDELVPGITVEETVWWVRI